MLPSLAVPYEYLNGGALLPTVVVIGRDGMVRHTTTGVPSQSDLDGWLAEP